MSNGFIKIGDDKGWMCHARKLNRLIEQNVATVLSRFRIYNQIDHHAEFRPKFDCIVLGQISKDVKAENVAVKSQRAFAIANSNSHVLVGCNAKHGSTTLVREASKQW